MTIKFMDSFNHICKRDFHITEYDINKTVEQPDNKETICLDQLTTTFFIKRTENLDEHLLVICKEVNDVLEVHFAFRLKNELIKELANVKPLDILQLFAQRFGLMTKVGIQLNKFIYLQDIPLSRKGISQVISIINPQNHVYISVFFFKILKETDKDIARCALVFCIDITEYLEWLRGTKKMQRENKHILITPKIRGVITELEILSTIKTITFVSSYSELKKGGFLYKIQSENYFEEFGFTNKSVYIIRNQDRLDYFFDLEKNHDEKVLVIAELQPDKLSILLIDNRLIETGKKTTNKSDAISRFRKEIYTTPTFPPNSLIEWARKNNLISTTEFNSPDELYETLINALGAQQDKINTTNMHDAFWDKQFGKNNKILSKKPKRETDIHTIIHGLLHDLALIKSLNIYHETSLANGKLDFLITGELTNGGKVNICIEFKNAHSRDLNTGLTKQLPTYMRIKGTDYGIYCVLDFRGNDFREPKIDNLPLHLHLLAIQNGISNIKRIIFEMQAISSPSNL